MEHSVQSLSEALLQELAMHAEPVSAARLTKKLGVRMSSLLRCVAYLGDQQIGEQAGLGWVAVVQDGDRTLLALTAKGRAACEEYKGYKGESQDGNGSR
ncbi:hypothetical protein [Undibacterium terreum]|uniref:Uncharacterized protein n=1 Tax=Undibacterium terreum TaxID=1224302 RepID=A0A916V0K2_9BURK|nr:hypothetical protein [Undibacterium terreum]GGC99076.1 hypothetical protein GCM10011396_53250 [Undibacterium terreum]